MKELLIVSLNTQNVPFPSSVIPTQLHTGSTHVKAHCGSESFITQLTLSFILLVPLAQVSATGGESQHSPRSNLCPLPSEDK